MIERIILELGPWSWWVLGLVLLAAEVVAPGVFLVWIGIAAILTGVVSLLFWEAGFWIWQVSSIEEAVEWAKRCPNPHPGESTIEIRPLFEAEDFGEELTPELRAQEQRLRDSLARH